MTVGSTFNVAPARVFFVERGYYVSGSLYRRFETSAGVNGAAQGLPANAVPPVSTENTLSGQRPPPLATDAPLQRAETVQGEANRVDLLV